jgi:hypothetical protein
MRDDAGSKIEPQIEITLRSAPQIAREILQNVVASLSLRTTVSRNLRHHFGQRDSLKKTFFASEASSEGPGTLL